jgi:hypothetical protein
LGAIPNWSGKRDSNSRPRPWQGRALPTELFPRSVTIVAIYLSVSRIPCSDHSKNEQLEIVEIKTCAQTVPILCPCYVDAHIIFDHPLASIEEVNGVPTSTEMIRNLSINQEATARQARKLLPIVNAANDQPREDLLTQRLYFPKKKRGCLLFRIVHS